MNWDTTILKAKAIWYLLVLSSLIAVAAAGNNWD